MTEILQLAQTLGPIGLAIILTVVVMLKFGPWNRARGDDHPMRRAEDHVEMVGGRQIGHTEIMIAVNRIVEMCDKIVTTQTAISSSLKDLYDMHNIRDNDGTPIWYRKKSHDDALDETIKNLATVIDQNTQVLRDLHVLILERLPHGNSN